MLRKKKENRKVSDRGCNKIRKLEGNPNITSKRLTILPGFLGLGVKSETIKKSSDRDEFPKDRNFILKEDLHGLFNTCLRVNPINLRRSERILKKAVALETSRCSAADYCDEEVINEQKVIECETTPVNKERSLYQNKSKSLFREINEKYSARANCSNNNLNFLTPPQDSPLAESSEKEVLSKSTCASEFCKNLRKELCLNLGHKALVDCKSRIVAKISKINCIISGKVDPESIMESEKFNLNKFVNSRDNEEVNFQYVPKTQWVYQTPPRQRMYVKAEECQMRPAVLCSTRKQTNIYEMKPNSRVDLSNCCNRQGVEVDNTFLTRVGSFEHEMDIDEANDIKFRKSDQQQNTEDGISSFTFFQNVSQPSGSVDNSFCLVNPGPENPFYNLISRPRKTAKTQSRLQNAMKRKLDQANTSDDNLYLNQASACHQTSEQSQNSCSESESYHSTRAHSPEFKFDFKRKLFGNGEIEKKFSFNKDKSKLFDFSQ